MDIIMNIILKKGKKKTVVISQALELLQKRLDKMGNIEPLGKFAPKT